MQAMAPTGGPDSLPRCLREAATRDYARLANQPMPDIDRLFDQVAAASAHLDELNRAHATISCNIPPDDATRVSHINTLLALYARAIELARAERLAASRARTACAHAAATIMPVHTVAQKSPVAYTPAADEPAVS